MFNSVIVTTGKDMGKVEQSLWDEASEVAGAFVTSKLWEAEG